MRNKMVLSTLREIKHSLGRYLSIMMIVALGVAFFGGLKTTKPSMVDTLNTFLRSSNFYDLRLLTSMGFEEDDVEKIRESSPDIVLEVEPSKTIDALCVTNAGLENAYRIYSVPDNINKVYLLSGRMPQNPDECLVDNYMSDTKIGDTISVTANNKEDTLDALKEHTLTVVGSVRSPLYVNYERGTTSIGTGSLSGFIYVPIENFDTDYYTDVYVTLDNDYDIYSEEYNDLIDEYTDVFEDIVAVAANDRYERVVTSANEELSDAKKELEDKKAEGLKELSDAKQKIEDGEKEITENEEKLAEGEANLISARDELRRADREYTESSSQLEAMKMFMSEGQYEESLKKLAEGRYEIDASWTLLREKQTELSDARQKIEDAREDLTKGREEYEEGLLEFDEKITEAMEKIADAEEKISDIEKAQGYVLDRNTNIGYACFDADSDIVESVSDVFPVFFFLVAVLICMTTMNRMIEEQRTEIGIYKALGFSFGSILGKYMFYACSASILGAVLGYAFGTNFMPQAIWQGYNIMYNMGSKIDIVFIPYLAIGSVAVAILCAAGSVYFSVVNEIREVPAYLIRPKAPRGGKRVFLEYITPIWSRMSFLLKVSFRNVFRYKKRFFMMVIGISGCTALVITGFGIGDSIKGIANRQFDNITVYDISSTFADDFNQSDKEEILTDEDIDKIAFIHITTNDIVASKGTKSINVVIPENEDDLLAFLNLRTKEGEKIEYPKDQYGVITAQIADTLGIEKGDEIVLRDSDMNERRVIVKDICENYVYNYIYLPFDDTEQINTAWINAKTDAKKLGTKLTGMESVMNVTTVSVLEGRIDNMMQSLDFIVMIVIAFAGALALVVVYNLTNINITERIREIATIKVLGFYPLEAAQYVFRENIILTAIGALLGIPLGKMLHAFIMYNIRIDMISFKTEIFKISYLLSVVMTFGFALLVNFMMYFKLQRINMAESLKSIE